MAEVLITLGIIGVVCAMTMPNLIAKHQKQTTVNRLKVAYSQLYQAVNLSVTNNGEIGEWDFGDVTAQEFFEKYISPYFKVAKSDYKSNTKRYILNNGTILTCDMYSNPVKFLAIYVDINGEKLPNIFGKDKFIFYVLPQKALVYNTGLWNNAKNVSTSGLYPDGYGYDRETLKNNQYRGCNGAQYSEEGTSANRVGAFCTALIMLDGWKISDDYNW